MTLSLRWVLGATLVMAGALGISRFAYTPLLPEMVRSFGWTFGQSGDVASANFLGYLLGALLAPAAAGSPQVRLWIAFSLMASVATTAAGAVVDDYLGWLILRFGAGVASAYCLVLVTTQLILVLEREKADYLGNVHFAGVGIGIVLCMLALLDVTDVASGWQRLGGASALLMMVAWLLLSTSIQPTPAGQSAASDSASPMTTDLVCLIVGYGFFGFGYVVSATFVVAMAEQLLQQTGQLADGTIVWWVVGLSIIPSVYAWQMLAHRLTMMRTLRLAYLVEAVGALLAAFSSSLEMLVFACVLLGGTFAAITALGISAAKQLAGVRVAYAVSAMTVAFAVGQLLGPALSGRIADYTGDFFWPSILAGVLLLASAFLVRGNQGGSQFSSGKEI